MRTGGSHTQAQPSSDWNSYPAAPLPFVPASAAPYLESELPPCLAPPGLGSLPPLPPADRPAAAAVAINTMIRCPCGKNWASHDPTDMMQCAQCGEWQHAPCMGYERGADRKGASHLCDRCRVGLADPFWETVYWLTATTQMERLVGVTRLPDCKRCELRFKFSAQEQQLLDEAKRGTAVQLQAVCVANEDHVRVPCRLHWPTNASIQVNTITQACRRSFANKQLGANARDEPVNITSLVYPKAANTVTFASHSDPGVYLLSLRFARRRSDAQVEAMMAAPEELPIAMQRMSRAAKRDDNDDDDDVIFDTFKVNLRCPLSGMRVRNPARFTNVSAFCVFDLDFFLDSVKRTRKWQCPISMRHSDVRYLQRDVYVERVLADLRGSGDVNEVEIDGEGRWRVNTDDPWHSILDPPPLNLPEASQGEEGSEDSFEQSLKRRKVAEDDDEEKPGVSGTSRASRPPPPPPEDVIDLCGSDDDDDAGPAPSRPPPPAATAAQPSGRKVVIRIPARSAAQSTQQDSSSQRFAKRSKAGRHKG